VRKLNQKRYLHSVLYFFFFFYWRYNPLWVLAFSLIFFHSALSSHCFLHRLTPIICKSSSLPAIHLFHGLPLVLVLRFVLSNENACHCKPKRDALLWNVFSACLEPSECYYVFPPHSTLRYQNTLHYCTRKTKRLVINYHSTAETILGLFFCGLLLSLPA